MRTELPDPTPERAAEIRLAQGRLIDLLAAAIARRLVAQQHHALYIPEPERLNGDAAPAARL